MDGKFSWKRKASGDAAQRRSAPTLEGYSRGMGRDRVETGAPPIPRRTDAEAPAALCRGPAIGTGGRDSLPEPVHGLFDRLTASRPRGRNVVWRSHRFGRPIMKRLGFADAS